MNRPRRRTALLCAFSVLAALPAAEACYRAALLWRTRRSSVAGRFELYAIGGSSTVGRPYRIGFPDLVGRMFDWEIGGRGVRVMNLARGGDSIYPQATLLETRLRYRDKRNPAAVLIYCGHNEAFETPLRLTALHGLYRWCKERALSRSLLASVILLRLEKRFAIRGLRDLRHYEFYLRRAVAASRAAGATPVLATMVSNESDVEPALTVGADMRLGRWDYEDIRSRVDAGRALESAGRSHEAAAFYEGLAAEDPAFAAYAYYRLGKSAQARGNADEARVRLSAAVDADPQMYRARSSQNALIRRLAAELQVPLVDAESRFRNGSPGGIIGANLFTDIMHPNREGTILIAEEFAGAVAAAFGEPIRRKFSDPEEAYAEQGPDPPERAHLEAGLMLLLHSTRLVGARDRLTLAERALSRAAALAPENPRARIALGVARSGIRDGYFLSGKPIRWLDENRNLYFSDDAVPAEKLAEIELILNSPSGNSR